jgi:eukaryotic translation initiation factor 2C
VIAFGSERDFPIHSIQAFIRELVNTCHDTGMVRTQFFSVVYAVLLNNFLYFQNIPNRSPPVMHGNPQGDVEGALKQAWLRAGNAAKAQPQLILCILPNTGVPLYAEIKRVSDTVIGVATQCVQSRHTMQPKKQYCANVCLKINVKLGGMNSFLMPQQIPFISERPTILMGADVTHPAPGVYNACMPNIYVLVICLILIYLPQGTLHVHQLLLSVHPWMPRLLVMQHQSGCKQVAKR